MTLMELSKEYEVSILNQKRVIALYRDKLNEAQSKFNYKEVKRLNTLLKVLYDEKSELEEMAVEIKKYLS